MVKGENVLKTCSTSMSVCAVLKMRFVLKQTFFRQCETGFVGFHIHRQTHPSKTSKKGIRVPLLLPKR